MLTPSTVEQERPQDLNLWPFGVGFLILAVLSVVGYALGGELGQFVYAGLQTLPFVVLAVLAYLGVDRQWARVLTVLWLVLIVIGLGLTTLLLSLATFIDVGQIQSGVQPDPAAVLPSGAQGTQLLVLWVGSLIATGIGALGFIPAVRRALSRVLPLDPTSFVHTIALVTTVACTLLTLLPLLVLGAPPLTTLARTMSDQGGNLAELQDGGSGLRTLVYTLVWQVPGAIVAVGYLIRRQLGEALSRLGMVRPTLRQVLAGIGLALLLVVGVSALDWLINLVWTAMGWTRTDGEAFEKMLAFAINPLGAVVIGVVAGLGEEISVRGVLQPRLGILLSNLFFTSLHALQYSWDGLLTVFLIGLVLGVIRKRMNTSTSAIVHGVYNFVLVMMAAYGMSF